MKIVQKTLFDELKVKYDLMIGWGVSRNEYERKYNPLMYHMDYMIDGQGRCVGSIVCGMKICDKSILNDMKDKKICFIIFPNIEDDVIEEVEKIGVKEFDTIVSGLLFLDETFYVRSFSERLEDVIFLAAMRKFNVSNPVYVDIGVCHPVIRNNTYLFYENGMREGLLIEPNPDMCKLIKEYRPQNQIVEAGVCGRSSGGGLKYYKHKVKSCVGHNTFSYEQAVKLGITDNYIEVPVFNINELLSAKLQKKPDIIDIDTEGLDEEIIISLDTKEFQPKLISIEEVACGSMSKIMQEKGYVHYVSTLNNGIYIDSRLL